MKHPASHVALILLATLLAARAQAQETGGTMNPLIDPFAVNARTVLPPPLPPKGPAVPLPPMAPAPSLPNAAFPVGLRALLIRDNGVGLLGAADTQASSIAVANGKTVRIGDQDYMAEVSASEIRLYLTPKGKLVWLGTLGGPAQVSPPVDMTQAHFTPPLSAGVNPGLRAAASGASSDAIIRKNGVQ
jgi:hypothetical protein